MATHTTDDWHRIGDDRLRHATRIAFVGSLLLFLVTILLGFVNVFTSGEIPHWQLITHLHSATLGWVTLTAIGVIIWQFGDAALTRGAQLAWAAVIVFGAYIASFGLGFYAMGNAYYLLPLFGTLAMLVIWATAYVALTRVSAITPRNVVHVQLAGAIGLAALGAILGVTRGLDLAVGLGIPEGLNILGGHAFTMDTYAIITTAALIEWLIAGDTPSEWSRVGQAQAGLWLLAGVLIWVGNLAGVMPIAAIGLLTTLILAPVIFYARIGWRALAETPFTGDYRSWAFFGALWFLVYDLGFIALFFRLIPQDTAWAGPVVFHSLYVGTITNTLLGVYSARTQDAPRLHEYAERGAMWLLNLGILTFFATEIAMGSRHGAIVMGLGVLSAVAVMLYRLLGESETIGGGDGATATAAD